MDRVLNSISGLVSYDLGIEEKAYDSRKEKGRKKRGRKEGREERIETHNDPQIADSN